MVQVTLYTGECEVEEVTTAAVKSCRPAEQSHRTVMPITYAADRLATLRDIPPVSNPSSLFQSNPKAKSAYLRHRMPIVVPFSRY